MASPTDARVEDGERPDKAEASQQSLSQEREQPQIDEDKEKEKQGSVRPMDLTLFDLEAFPHFVPLLNACTRYAKRSGCRFRASSFPGLRPQEDDEALDTDSAANPKSVVNSRYSHDSSELAARTAALPTVLLFAEQLNVDQDPVLIEELQRATDIVMAESVRNAMITAFRTLEMWPPEPKPADVADDDYSYEDVFADLVHIAQRAYNDQTRRDREAAATQGCCLVLRRARTASWLVDFAQEIGFRSPPMCETQQMMLQEFARRLQDWENQQQLKPAAREAFLAGLGVNAVADKLREDAKQWWSAPENRQTVFWTAAGLVTIGPVGTGLALWARHAWNKRNTRLAAEAEEAARAESAAQQPELPDSVVEDASMSPGAGTSAQLQGDTQSSQVK